MGVMRSLLLRGSQSDWLHRQVTRRRFARRAVRRFLPGETVEAALTAAEELHDRGMTTLVTQLGEDVHDRREAEAVRAHYEGVLERIRRAAYPTHLSLKPTQLGLDIGADLCHELYDGLVAQAAESGSMVWVDMEASPYVDTTLELFHALRERHANVGVCLQAYLFRTADDLEALLPLGPAIRLVKGAYDEPPHLAFARKQDTDASLLKLAKRLLGEEAREMGATLGLGTHDVQLIARLNDYAEGARLPKDAYEIQMLYGIRTQDQLRLAAGGYAMRVLISYGNAWFRWYMRRLAERPANLLFLAKSVVR